LVVPYYKAAAEADADKSKDNASSNADTPSAKVYKKPQLLLGVDSSSFQNSLLDALLEDQEFKGDAGTKKVVRVFGADSQQQKVKYVALVGMGEVPKESKADMTVAAASKFASSIVAAAAEASAKHVGVLLPAGMTNAAMSQVMLSMHDSLYVDNRYKKAPEKAANEIAAVRFLGCPETVAADLSLTQSLSEMIASGVQFAKDLVAAPSNSKTPVVIAEQIKQQATELGLEVKILGEKECRELGMGSYLGVQQGSMFPPQFIHVTYRPPQQPAEVEEVHRVALIGKGLTFDSGGYNLKVGPGSMIEQMKDDMGGLAAVFGAMKAIGQLKPKNVEVHFISAVCENMVSAQAMRPGDILVASNGKTIEVLNTDAEGRLTLADALVYAEKQCGVDTMIDLATLTGACLVALGDKVAALYSNNDELKEGIERAAQRTGEKLWHMPLEAAYRESLKSNIADLKNIAGMKGAGSITAALFLQEFVEKAQWAHIDMAGPVWDSYATGYGVKTLVDYLLNSKKPSTTNGKKSG